MKILCIEDSADGLLDLAVRAQRLGHQSRYHCRAYDPVRAPVGRGLVERAATWQESARWADLIVVGGNGKWIVELDRLRAQGVPIVGGCASVAALELDRLAGMAMFKRAGIPVPPFRQCSALREAIEYVAKEDTGFAVKVCGDVSDKSTSVVAKTAPALIWRLKRWEKEGRRFPSGVIVQERVEGVEFAVGAWCGPDGFAEGWEENFETKKLFPGDLGPATGEQGTVMRLVRHSKLAEKVLAPFEDWCVRQGYVGNIDVNCIVDKEGNPWPLEFTCRLGWPAFNIECALHVDPVEFLAGLAAGKPPKSRRLNEVAVGVVMAIPNYPYGHENPEEVVNVPIWGVTPALEDRLHYVNVMQGNAPVVEDGRIGQEAQIATSGSYVLVATGTGETVVKARGQVHRALDRLTVPASPFWRIDIGQRLRGQLPELQAQGYARGLEYS